MTDLQQGAPSAPPAGWYPDPVRPGSTRFWSGTGWTDQVSTPVAETAVPPLAPYDPITPYDPFTAVAGAAVEPPPVAFASAPPAPSEAHGSQSEWHQTRARPIARVGMAPVSSSARAVSSSAGATSDPYDRNWMAGVAIVLAVASIPGLAVRVLMDLPALTQSIFAGAPIGISLLALAWATRHRSGRVLSLIAVLISAATLVAAFFVDPEIIRGIVDSILGLIPA